MEHGSSSRGQRALHKSALASASKMRQSPEELGFTDIGDSNDLDGYGESQFNEGFCLDLGAKGFPIPTFKKLQESNWDAAQYFELLQANGYAEDALQMTGPKKAILSSDCMKEHFRGRMKHIFVGDSQMMSLRNAFHRLNKCPEIWWSNHSADMDDMRMVVQRNMRDKPHLMSKARFHSTSNQAPAESALPAGCTEEGIASFVHWDAWADPELPVQAIKKEMEMVGVDPHDGDNVIVWVGSNFIHARKRMSTLIQTIDTLQSMKVKMVWDSPTFQDEAIMSAASTHDAGRDPRSRIPVTFTSIKQRKTSGYLGSNEYKTEKELFNRGLEIPTTKRWQLTNRYRGLQCDGMHTDMRARDPLFYALPCPMGQQRYGQSTYCNWVEPFNSDVAQSCPLASGLDDLVLQSGLYSICAAHEQPFCYQYTESIR